MIGLYILYLYCFPHYFCISSEERTKRNSTREAIDVFGFEVPCPQDAHRDDANTTLVVQRDL